MAQRFFYTKRLINRKGDGAKIFLYKEGFNPYKIKAFFVDIIILSVFAPLRYYDTSFSPSFTL
ncbi:hypothetical protein D3C80_699200 [compost metagenome]